jgi:prefoldin alpha subunit
MSSPRIAPASQRTSRAASNVQESVSDQKLQEQFNQLLQEVRILEAYYQEITSRQQTVSAALVETRAASEAINSLTKSESNELLIPVGAGTLIYASTTGLKRAIVSVGAGVAIEKDVEAAKAFLQARRQDLEKAMTSLEGQRKEIGTRLDAGRATIQRITGSAVT